MRWKKWTKAFFAALGVPVIGYSISFFLDGRKNMSLLDWTVFESRRFWMLFVAAGLYIVYLGFTVRHMIGKKDPAQQEDLLDKILDVFSLINKEPKKEERDKGELPLMKCRQTLADVVIDKLAKDRRYMLYGEGGCGKSYVCRYIYKRLTDQGATARWIDCRFDKPPRKEELVGGKFFVLDDFDSLSRWRRRILLREIGRAQDITVLLNSRKKTGKIDGKVITGIDEENALFLMRENNIKGMENNVTDLVRITGGNPQALLVLAKAYEKGGERLPDLSKTDKKFTLKEKKKKMGKITALLKEVAGYWYDEGYYSIALGWYLKALTIERRRLKRKHPDICWLYNEIGCAYRNMCQYDQALVWHEKARKIREEVLEANHPDLAVTYNNIGAVYHAMGQYDQALAWYEKARKIQEEVLEENHPALAVTYNNIGTVYRAMGQNDQALVWHLKDLKICEEVLEENHPALAVTYNNIGTVYRAMGQYDQALVWHLKDLKICEEVLEENHPALAVTYNNIGAVYHAMGQYDQALAWYEKARRIREEVLKQTIRIWRRYMVISDRFMAIWANMIKRWHGVRKRGRYGKKC